MKRTAILLSLLTIGCLHATSTCTDRRCLAQHFISKEYLSQPQYENCTIDVDVPFMEYQTLSVDTKELRLMSRLYVRINWVDPALTWNTTVYEFDRVVLPVDKVWTPELYVENGITTTMTHASNDLVVYFNGTVTHRVILHSVVNCEVNMFNYPFAGDQCPVGIQTSPPGDCGINVRLQKVMSKDGSHGDWQTNSATMNKKGDNHHYINVDLDMKPSSSVITLLLPSILILIADIVSFALPLGGGERNTFKVTLVLSFTMFLNILSTMLPGDSECSPIIRYHFLVCLILLVLSMLVSIVLTRVAIDGLLFFCNCSKKSFPAASGHKEGNEDEEKKADLSVTQSGDSEDTELLKKVVDFLEAFKYKESKNEQHHELAEKLDKIFFWFYFIICVIYVCAMFAVMVKYPCVVNHFEFYS